MSTPEFLYRVDLDAAFLDDTVRFLNNEEKQQLSAHAIWPKNELTDGLDRTKVLREGENWMVIDFERFDAGNDIEMNALWSELVKRFTMPLYRFHEHINTYRL